MKGDVEDWLTELPPLDGSDDDVGQDETVDTDELSLDEGAGTALDDSAAEDLEIGESIETLDDDPSNAEDEGWQADVGEAELDTADEEESWSESDADGPNVGESDVDIADDMPADDDHGEEGTAEPIEHSLDEELPPLDADAEGDFEDALLSELRMGTITPETQRFAESVWEATTCSTWSWSDDDEVDAALVHTSPDLLVALTSEGGVWVSTHRERAPALAGRVPDELIGSRGGRLLLACAGAKSIVWVASSDGQLAKSTDRGRSFTRCPGPGHPLLALAAHEDGSLSVLARRGAATEVLTSVDGARWFVRRIAADLQIEETALSRTRIWMCASGTAMAIGDARGVSISRDGEQFVRLPGAAGATAGAFAGSAPRAPFLFATGPGEAHAIHLMLASFGQSPEVVAELEPRGLGGESSVLALSWDAALKGARLAFASELLSVRPHERITGRS